MRPAGFNRIIQTRRCRRMAAQHGTSFFISLGVLSSSSAPIKSARKCLGLENGCQSRPNTNVESPTFESGNFRGDVASHRARFPLARFFACIRQSS